MTRRVVFDLDQTLIRGDASVDSDWRIWLVALEAALGIRIPEDEDWASHPNHTDHCLFVSISERHRGCAPSAEERAVYELHYVRGMEEVSRRPNGLAEVTGARAALAAFAGRVAIATGNLHRVTVLKLRASGLDLPGIPCACSDDAADRVSLVRCGLERIGWRPGEPATSVGDGVWDVRAARALGVGFVGIASSDEHEERLRKAGARAVLRDFSDLAAVLALVDAAEPPG